MPKSKVVGCIKRQFVDVMFLSGGDCVFLRLLSVDVEFLLEILTEQKTCVLKAGLSLTTKTFHVDLFRVQEEEDIESLLFLFLLRISRA